MQAAGDHAAAVAAGAAAGSPGPAEPAELACSRVVQGVQAALDAVLTAVAAAADAPLAAVKEEPQDGPPPPSHGGGALTAAQVRAALAAALFADGTNPAAATAAPAVGAEVAAPTPPSSAPQSATAEALAVRPLPAEVPREPAAAEEPASGPPSQDGEAQLAATVAAAAVSAAVAAAEAAASGLQGGAAEEPASDDARLAADIAAAAVTAAVAAAEVPVPRRPRRDPRMQPPQVSPPAAAAAAVTIKQEPVELGGGKGGGKRRQTPDGDALGSADAGAPGAALLVRRLCRTACLRKGGKLGMAGAAFQELLGWLPPPGGASVGATDLHSGNGYELWAAYDAAATCVYLSGRQYTRWVADSGAREHDSVQLQACGGRLLLLHIPADDDAGPAPKRRRRAAAAPAEQRLPATGAATSGSAQQRPTSSTAAPAPPARPSSSTAKASAQAPGGAAPQQELKFAPWRTRDLQRALHLAADLPSDQALQRVQCPTPGSQHTLWRITVSASGQDGAYFGRLDRTRAAVAGDVVLAWRRCRKGATGQELRSNEAWNVPGAGYEDDGPLMRQLRCIETPGALLEAFKVIFAEGPRKQVPIKVPVAPPPPPPPQQQQQQPSQAPQPPQQHHSLAAQPAAAAGSEAAGGPGEKLGFTPRTTPSIAAGLRLAAALPPNQRLVGANQMQAKWAAQRGWRGDNVRLGRLDRARAAVASDLITALKRWHGEDVGSAFNVPAAAYLQDRQLTGQLSCIESAEQMCLFLQAVIGQDPSRKGMTRKQRWQEDQAAKQRQQQQQQPTPAAAHPNPATPPARAAAAAASAAAGDKLLRLRRFAGHCQSLFPGMDLPPEALHRAQAGTLEALLGAELGPAVLGDLQARAGLRDGRDEWQRLVDLLRAADPSLRVSREAVQRFFPPPAPKAPCADFRALHKAGIYTVAWELPLDPQAVQDVQREQAKLQAELRRGSKGAGFAAQHVGARLSVFWEAEDEWYPGCILDVDTRGRGTMLYDDGETNEVDPRTMPCIFLPLAAAAEERGEGTDGEGTSSRKRARQEDGGDDAPPQSRHKPPPQSARSPSPAPGAAAGASPAAVPAPARSGGTWSAGGQPRAQAAAALPTAEHAAADHLPPQQQQQQPRHTPPLPTPSAGELGSRSSPAPGGGQAAAASLAALEARLRERRLEQAVGSLLAAEAAMEDREGLKKALASLALALGLKKTGRPLKEAVDAWDGYSPAQQDAVFEAAVLSQEDWAGLEENLHYALLQQQ